MFLAESLQMRVPGPFCEVLIAHLQDYTILIVYSTEVYVVQGCYFGTSSRLRTVALSNDVICFKMSGGMAMPDLRRYADATRLTNFHATRPGVCRPVLRLC